MARQHVVLLAFADARGDLPELREEIRRLQDLFERFQGDGRCTLIFRPNVTLDQLYHELQRHRDRIAIVHFGGHADSGRLLLEAGLEGGPAHAEGLATLFGQQRGLKLVFLNGCSTRPQVQRLLEAGVPAVIATARPIDDRVARDFSVAFYEALTTGGDEIKGGQSLAAAFAAAHGFVRASHVGASRDFVAAEPGHDDVTDSFGFPWDIQVRRGSERVERWNLFDDDPLFGLPELPADIGLPAEPFRKLEWFGREHARIFAGRGQAIRELYDLVTRSSAPNAASVIFYYGQTGVGKTSVLAAGLLPRLEASFDVRYLRRGADHGLLGTLRAALLTGEAEPFDLGVSWLAEESSAGRPLVVVLDQAEEAFTRPLVAAPSTEDAESLTRAWIDPEVEVRALIHAVRATFDPIRGDRPQGRLILAFRKEWLDEFEKACKAVNLSFESVPLSSLDPAGVIEATRGPVSEPALEQKLSKYRLTISTEDPPLPNFLASDLLGTLADPKKNQFSPVAPTLQILLTRMWAEARKRDRDQPVFDRSLYTELKSQGYQLGEVIDQQLKEIGHDDPEAVDNGLLLDILEWFTTSLGTAATRTKASLHARYAHQPPHRLEALVEACQNRYLLAGMGTTQGDEGAHRLTHDTLAPLIRERFRVSTAPAQRARRLLESRAPDWKGQHTDPVLDRLDLRFVEEGLPWMRAAVKDEQRDEPGLIEASRQAEKHRLAVETERQRELNQAREHEARAEAGKQRETELRLEEKEAANVRLRWGAFALFCSLVATLTFAGFAWKQWGDAYAQTKRAEDAARKEKEQTAIARKEERIARSGRIAVMALGELGRRDDLAYLLSAAAFQLSEPADTTEARHALLTVLNSRPGLCTFFHNESRTRRFLRFSPDGKTLLEGYVRSDGSGGVGFHDIASRRRLRNDLELGEGNIETFALDTAGKTLAVVRGNSSQVITLCDDQGRRLGDPLPVRGGRVNSMAFSSDGKTLAVGHDFGHAQGAGLLSLFDIDARSPLGDPIKMPAETSHILAFSPDGKTLALLCSSGSGSFVVLYDIRGRVQLPDNLGVGEVTSLAFAPDGKGLAVASSGFLGDGLFVQSFNVAASGRYEKLFKPLELRDRSRGGQLTSDSRTLVATYTQGGGWGVILYDLETSRFGGNRSAAQRQIGKPFEVFQGNLGATALTLDRKTLAVGYHGIETGDGVALFDANQPLPLGETLPMGKRRSVVKCVAFSPDGKTLVAECGDPSPSNLAFYDVSEHRQVGPPVAVPDAAFGTTVRSVVFSHDGKTLAAVCGSGHSQSLALFDVPTRRLRHKPIPVPDGVFASVAFSPGSKIIAAAHQRGVAFYDATSHDRLGDAILAPESDVRSVAFSPDGRTLAAGYGNGIKYNGGLILLDVASRKPLGDPLAVSKANVQSVAFSSDGRTLAAGYSNALSGGIVLYDVQRHAQVGASLVVPEGGVVSLAFGPADGSLAVAYSGPGTGGSVLLFDVASRRRLGNNLGNVPSGAPTSVVFSPDGRILAAGYGDDRLLDDRSRGVILFDVDPKSWQRRASQIANRNLTSDEWSRYIGDEVPYQRHCPELPNGLGVNEAVLKGELRLAEPAARATAKDGGPSES